MAVASGWLPERRTWRARLLVEASEPAVVLPTVVFVVFVQL